MTEYEEYMKKIREKEEYENSIPSECKRCTLLEKDYLHKTVKCIYRSKDRCMLEPYMRKKDNKKEKEKKKML